MKDIYLKPDKKYCNGCNKIKLKSEFTKGKSRCRSCMKIVKKSYYDRNYKSLGIHRVSRVKRDGKLI